MKTLEACFIISRRRVMELSNRHHPSERIAHQGQLPTSGFLRCAPVEGKAVASISASTFCFFRIAVIGARRSEQPLRAQPVDSPGCGDCQVSGDVLGCVLAPSNGVPSAPSLRFHCSRTCWGCPRPFPEYGGCEHRVPQKPPALRRGAMNKGALEASREWISHL